MLEGTDTNALPLEYAALGEDDHDVTLAIVPCMPSMCMPTSVRSRASGSSSGSQAHFDMDGLTVVLDKSTHAGGLRRMSVHWSNKAHHGNACFTYRQTNQFISICMGIAWLHGWAKYGRDVHDNISHRFYIQPADLVA